MNLVLDFGNTTTKVGLFKNNQLVEELRFTDHQEVLAYIEQSDYKHALLASVSDRHIYIASDKNIEVLNTTTPLPFQINYETPETLGADRLAAAAGAQTYFPNKNCLVIDSGTCITYEFLSADNIYQGGAISPGIKMRFQALHNFTAGLPLVESGDSPQLVGKSTKQCIESGVINGIIHEITATIEAYKQQFVDLEIILCGGNLDLFETKLKESIFVQPNLVLYGLNRILEYNVE